MFRSQLLPSSPYLSSLDRRERSTVARGDFDLTPKLTRGRNCMLTKRRSRVHANDNYCRVVVAVKKNNNATSSLGTRLGAFTDQILFRLVYCRESRVRGGNKRNLVSSFVCLVERFPCSRLDHCNRFRSAVFKAFED